MAGGYTDRVQDFLTQGVHGKALAEAKSSGLVGAKDGPQDAYRHILRAAEMTRQGQLITGPLLWAREQVSSTHAGMDTHNNQVGFAIGEYVRQKGGDWEMVKQLSRRAVDTMLAGIDPQDVKAGEQFKAEPGGYLTRGKMKLADGLEIDSPAVLPSARWDQPDPPLPRKDPDKPLPLGAGPPVGDKPAGGPR